MSLVLADGQSHYTVETYARNTAKSGLTLAGPIGLDGNYRKGKPIYHGLSERLEGMPRVDATKGTWQGENTFLIERLCLGEGEPPEQWTLSFFGTRVNLLARFPEGQETFIEGEAGG